MYSRRIMKTDLPVLRRIHEEQYTGNFPDMTRMESMRVVIDDNRHIVSFGGVELIAEGVTLTDKTVNPVTRGRALKMLLSHMEEVTVNLGCCDLHAFVPEREGTWRKSLIHNKFRPIEDIGYYRRVKE